MKYNNTAKYTFLRSTYKVYTALRVTVRLSSNCFSSSVGGSCLSGLKLFFPRKSGLAGPASPNGAVSLLSLPSGSLFVAIWMMRKMEHMATMTICKNVPHESSNNPTSPPPSASQLTVQKLHEWDSPNAGAPSHNALSAGIVNMTEMGSSNMPSVTSCPQHADTVIHTHTAARAQLSKNNVMTYVRAKPVRANAISIVRDATVSFVVASRVSEATSKRSAGLKLFVELMGRTPRRGSEAFVLLSRADIVRPSWYPSKGKPYCWSSPLAMRTTRVGVLS